MLEYMTFAWTPQFGQLSGLAFVGAIVLWLIELDNLDMALRRVVGQVQVDEKRRAWSSVGWMGFYRAGFGFFWR